MENPPPDDSTDAAPSGTDAAPDATAGKDKSPSTTPVLLGLSHGPNSGLLFLIGGAEEGKTPVLLLPAPPVDEDTVLPRLGSMLNEHLAAVAAELLRALAPHLRPGFMERLVVPPRMGEQTPERWDFLAELRAYAATPEGAPVQEMMIRHAI